MSKSESLLSVHLSGNPDLISSLDNIKIILDIKSDRKTTTNIAHSNLFMPSKMNNNIKAFSFDKMNMSFFDKLQMRDISKSKRSLMFQNESEKYENPEDILIFTRLINHREIPGMQQWNETKECFICDNWHYTVIR
jgi:hypothetical protein